MIRLIIYVIGCWIVVPFIIVIALAIAFVLVSLAVGWVCWKFSNWAGYHIGQIIRRIAMTRSTA